MTVSVFLKKAFPALSFLFFLNHLIAQPVIKITNNSNFDRTEIVSIPFKKFSKHFKVDTIFTIKDKASNHEIVYQIEKLGKILPQNILVQVSVKSGQTLYLSVLKEKSTPFQSKVFARYVPERKDDFAWENDIVAFRFYGKALEGTSEDAQGIDFWAKRTNQLVINKWYKSNDYHKDYGEGLDYYSVGQSLGVGEMALFFNDSIQFTKHYRTYQILDNGPLRTTFKLVFMPEKIKGNTIELSKTISLDAGSQLNKIVVSLNNLHTATTPVVIGLSKRNEKEPQYYFDTKNQSLVYWEPDINKNGQTGTAVIIQNNKAKLNTKNSKQFLVELSIKNNKPIIHYYAGAAWNKAGAITSFEEWKAAIYHFIQSKEKPLKVQLK